MAGLKRWTLPFLACPQCLSALRLESLYTGDQDDTLTGVLICSDHQCKAWFPVVGGVPRLLPENLRLDLTRDFVKSHAEWLSSLGLPGVKTESVQGWDALTDIKQKVGKNFGFEWSKYDRFGWDDPVYTIAKEEGAFQRKALLTEGEIRQKLVLDAGCGNGRYTHWAAKYGARVIGIELGEAVEAAARNTAELPNVQIVQADIFSLPFPPAQFDAVFSIGVLMLTGSAKKATLCLARQVKTDGTLTAHVYGRGNAIYEMIDHLIRLRTARMSIPQLERFTERAFRLRCKLDRWGVADFVTRYVRLDDHPHCIFDWYSAPSATHHTYEEVMSWLEEGGLQVTATRKRLGGRSSIRGRLSHILSKPPASVTVKGVRRVQ